MQCYFRFKLNLIPANTTGIKNTVLVIQFQSVNYTLVAEICKNLEQNKLLWYWCSRRKQWLTGFKVNRTFAIHVLL